MRDLLFILMLVVAVIYWMLNPDQVDSAINWVVSPSYSSKLPE